ncbi:hypothetical protein [Leptospira haakeii]|uniref:Lipoprotein n=1 Tax=Leptospira haakeii TaxID=2023198 RepID=A0ABX4PNA6_9LEPT|nr:hypothetical protein [Leptospira haakeii]PKA17271.1 hypothetical protein CH363_01055 [Leptospira haakeii]PKA20995.1 hypothetical protein CH377_01055 [Leptospira haakeii]
MKKIIFSFLLLAFLSSCKECNSAKEESEVSFDLEGIYVVSENALVNQLAGEGVPFKSQSVCIEIQKPDVLIIRYLDLKQETDLSMKWAKVEVGKYKISNKDKVAYFYDYSVYKNTKHPQMSFLLSLKNNKPLEKETEDYSMMTRSFRIPSLDDCTIAKREELNTPPDPGPENNWGKDK